MQRPWGKEVFPKVNFSLQLAVLNPMKPNVNPRRAGAAFSRASAFMRTALLLVSLAGPLIPQSAAGNEGARLTLVKRIPLPKVSGRIDHFTLIRKTTGCSWRPWAMIHLK
jgi:hypothetical protein